MRLRSPSVAAFALLAMSVAGCVVQRSGHGHGRSSDAAPPELRPTLRGAIEPDLSLVPAAGQAESRAASYYELPVAICQCRAVERSAIGELLSNERNALYCAAAGRGDCALQLQSQLVSSAERDGRNRAAAAALETFYKLAELEGQLDLVERGLSEATTTLERIAAVRAEGVRVPIDETELIRTKLDLTAQRIEIIGGIERANAALRSLLELPLHAEDRLWPMDDWRPAPEALDVETEIARGLAHSAELDIARSLQASLSPKTLFAARAALSKIEGLAGISPTAAPFLDFMRSLIGRPTGPEREAASRRRQIADHAERREAELASEIQQRISATSEALSLVGLARDELASSESRLADLEAKADTGQSTFVEIAQARLAMYESRGRTLQRMIAWKIALVKLRETQGLLVEECRPSR